MKSQPLPCWRTDWGTNGMIPGFVEFIRSWLCTIPPERDRSRGDAIAYIRNQEKSGDLSILEVRAQEWQLTEQQARENQRLLQQAQAITYPPDPPPDPPGQPDPQPDDLCGPELWRKCREALKQGRQQAAVSEPLPPPQVQVAQPDPPPPDLPRDLEAVLIQIQIHLKRLGLTKADAIAHMVSHHHWPPTTFPRLDNEQLVELLDTLEHLPGADGPLTLSA